MCKFFSFLTDGKGNMFYIDHAMREKILKGESNLRADSHASIAEYCFGNSHEEDNYNCYEYNPLTEYLNLDCKNLNDDRELIDRVKLVEAVKEAVPELSIKQIIDPFKDRKFEGKITPEIIELVKNWDSVWASVWDSVWDSVGDSVGASVRASVWDSVWDSVGDSVGASVWASVGDYVGAYVGAYVSSFFNLESWLYISSDSHINPFQSCIDLWEIGLVPSFDGKTWRLHNYKGIVWEENVK